MDDQFLTYSALSSLMPSDAAMASLQPGDLHSQDLVILPRVDARVALFIRKSSAAPRSALCIERFLPASELNQLITSLTPQKNSAIASVDLLLENDTVAEGYDVIVAPLSLLSTHHSLKALATATLAEWHLVVVPLSVLPGRPLEGFFTVSHSAFSNVPDMIAAALKVARHEAIEELTLLQAGYDFATVQHRPYGLLRNYRKESDAPHATIRSLKPWKAVPATSSSAAWPIDGSDSDIFSRAPLQNDFACSKDMGVFVAREDAASHSVSDAALIWTAGLTTWRKLNEKGIWVSGTADSLGEDEFLKTIPLLPKLHWVKMSHAGPLQPDDQLPLIATYTLTRSAPVPDLSGKTHFFWRSGSLFLEALGAYPEISAGFHWSGPGNTRRTLLQYVPEERCGVALSLNDWKKQVVYEHKEITAAPLHAEH